jgi:cephalosporin hydroxylase
MKCTIDTDSGSVLVEQDGSARTVSLYSTEGFELISDLWLKVGWNQKHVYTFSWLGRPIIQLPDDLVRIQEVIGAVQPDVIVECGVAHGGALVYYASLCKIFGRGRVIGIDIEIRPHNRAAIEAHPLADLITLIEASSTDPATVAAVTDLIEPGETTLVLLDSSHTREHVLAELEAYSGLVSVGSYVVVMDGIMELAADTPRGGEDWSTNNPIAAVDEFLRAHPEFVLEQPEWQFNESELRKNVTHWPHGYLRRVS